MIVKKWLPYPMWDFAGIEHWLNEQAQSGYLLNGWPGWSFIGRVPFRTDPDAPRTRYRLDPGVDLFGAEELGRRISSYRDSGWRYEGKVRKLYAIYSCDDPQAPELYNDTFSMALAMKKQIRRVWFTLFLLVLWLVAAFWNEWVLLLTRPASFASGLILDSDVRMPLCGVMILGAALLAASRIGFFLGVYRIRACLRRGEWPAPRKRSYPELWRGIAAFALLLGTVLYLLYLLWFYTPNFQRLSGPEEWMFPHVTLEEIVPEGAELRLYNNQELLHYDEWFGSSLAPEQYDVAQGGAVQAADGTEADARVNQKYIRCLSPALAEMVYRGILENQRRYYTAREQTYEETALSQGSLDSLTRFTPPSSDAHMVYVGLAGKRVFVLDCSGMLDADTALSLLLERLEAEG